MFFRGLEVGWSSSLKGIPKESGGTPNKKRRKPLVRWGFEDILPSKILRIGSLENDGQFLKFEICGFFFGADCFS